jgi:predicted phosphodiesterase
MEQIVLIHISDVHCGGQIMNDESAFFSGLKSGYNPHDYRLLQPLELAIRDACDQMNLSPEHQPWIVLSGDVTQYGLDNDYATAFGIMFHRWRWKRAPPRWIGFGWPEKKLIIVPGNHDHWRWIRRPTAYTPGLSAMFFDLPTPWRRVLLSEGARIKLELLGVDSNSGLEGSPGSRNLRAGGSISDSEIGDLRDELQRSEREVLQDGQVRVRALVCHHAFSSKGIFAARPLADASRRQLETLAEKYRMPVVMTGHTHAFHEEDWRCGTTGWNLKELRCATTLQGPAKIGIQGFWVHQIVYDESSRKCSWRAWKYQFGAKFYDLCPEPVEVALE